MLIFRYSHVCDVSTSNLHSTAVRGNRKQHQIGKFATLSSDKLTNISFYVKVSVFSRFQQTPIAILSSTKTIIQRWIALIECLQRDAASERRIESREIKLIDRI